MFTTYHLARDHLQQAAAILQGPDSRSRQLVYIVQRTISLIDDLTLPTASPANNVLDFVEYKAQRECHS